MGGDIPTIHTVCLHGMGRNNLNYEK